MCFYRQTEHQFDTYLWYINTTKNSLVVDVAGGGELLEEHGVVDVLTGLEIDDGPVQHVLQLDESTEVSHVEEHVVFREWPPKPDQSKERSTD